MGTLPAQESSTSRAGSPGPELWRSGFQQALRRYRRVTIAGWMVAGAGLAGLILRWSSPGLLGLMDIVTSLATVAAGILLVQYGIEGLSGFIRTALRAMPGEQLAELRGLMEEVEEGGWQEAFAALTRLHRMSRHEGEPFTH